MKAIELTGSALDYAVAICEGIDHDTALLNTTVGDDTGWVLSPSTDWLQGGSIIEKEKITLTPYKTEWGASLWSNRDSQPLYTHAHRTTPIKTSIHCMGETPLIAAMRCYVINKMGYEINIPEELSEKENNESNY